MPADRQQGRADADDERLYEEWEREFSEHYGSVLDTQRHAYLAGLARGREELAYEIRDDGDTWCRACLNIVQCIHGYGARHQADCFLADRSGIESPP